ncbi:uncharacterized protein LOC142520229 [Primulina tabacum]|uniref:uncharacterized protein LOC142520229 n=1 Tax=Primulina tabacum TaxID=48773 RepID=UPI003F59597E
MIQYQVRFGGSQTEDPNAHLEGFLSICDTIKFNGVSTDAIRLRLFPFSLHGEAVEWLRDLPACSIATWNGFVKIFMNQYFPPTKLAQLRMDISSFRQKDRETLHKAWGRFRKMLRRCPQHGFSSSEQVQIFYNGVYPSVRSMLDAAANSILYRKTPRVALEIISNMAENSAGWPDIKRGKKGGVLEMDVLNELTAKIDGLARKFSQLQSNQANQVQGIFIDEQPIFDEETVNFVGNQWRQLSNPYSSTYNPGWKHNPNLSWKNTENSLNPTHIPPLPIPQQKFHINIPFAETLAQMPSYAKFFIDILTKKRKLVYFETATLSDKCSSILQNKLPPKLKDPCSFSIPCTIGSSKFYKALCDLGASINLMSYSCFKKLGIGEVKPATISLQLVDRSIKYPRGVIEDVLVKVDKFIFPVTLLC